MSEDETRNENHEEDQDEVEAHHGPHRVLANEEPKSDDAGDDEVEAHGPHRVL